jgi:hypothetical protein
MKGNNGKVNLCAWSNGKGYEFSITAHSGELGLDSSIMLDQLVFEDGRSDGLNIMFYFSHKLY